MKKLISQAVVSSHVTMNSCLIIAFMKQASESEDAWGLLQVQPVTGEAVLISPNHFRLDQRSFYKRYINGCFQEASSSSLPLVWDFSAFCLD